MSTSDWTIPTTSPPGPNYASPTPSTLASIASTPILSETGDELPFSALLTSPSPASSSSDSQTHTHLIIFIRHFFCGSCEAYVRALTTHLPPSRLAPAHTDLTIIGCGDPALVPAYKSRTACPFPIFCDPARSLYTALGMTCTLDTGDRTPAYQEGGLLAATVASMWNMVRSGAGMMKGGKYSQNGGEWVFRGARELVWCHRMGNTRDHAEVGELERVLGLDGGEAGDGDGEEKGKGEERGGM